MAHTGERAGNGRRAGRTPQYRPGTSLQGIGGCRRDLARTGSVSAWRHKLANHSRATYLERDGSPAEIGNYEFPAGFVPALHFEYVPVLSRIPLGPWRAVDHSSNVFVVDSVIDELARKSGADPVAFLRRLIGDEQYVQVREDFPFDASRLLRVVEEAARDSNWGSRLAKGSGRGIAASYNQGSWVSEVAEVSLVDRALKVERIVAFLKISATAAGGMLLSLEPFAFLRRITRGAYNYTQPAWSADGRRLAAFRWLEDEAGEIGHIVMLELSEP